MIQPLATRSIRRSHLRLCSTISTPWSGPVKVLTRMYPLPFPSAAFHCSLCLSFFLRSVLSHVTHRAATSCVLPPERNWLCHDFACTIDSPRGSRMSFDLPSPEETRSNRQSTNSPALDTAPAGLATNNPTPRNTRLSTRRHEGRYERREGGFVGGFSVVDVVFPKEFLRSRSRGTDTDNSTPDVSLNSHTVPGTPFLCESLLQLVALLSLGRNNRRDFG